MSTYAVVKTRFQGLHRYPDAPAPVEFLSHPHRHEFHVRVLLQQFHDERDVEYLQFKDELNAVLKGFPMHEADSCETMARMLAQILTGRYPGRGGSVRLTEDGENGAIVTFGKARDTEDSGTQR